MPKAKIELLHDNPLKFSKEDKEYKNDGLNFNEYTNVLSNAIIHTPTPFTIGIFGEWGKGKTSFLEMIKYKIEQENKKYVTVWFNAWQYEKEEHPIVPLIAIIIKALQDNKGKIKKGFEDFVTVLRSVAYGFSAEIGAKVLDNEAKLQFSSKDMIDRYEQLLASSLLDKSLYFDAFDKLDTLNNDDNSKIVVFIDDLDRCMPDNAVKLLESIKLVLAQKGFTFVLGIAHEIIEGYLNKKYKEDFGITNGNHGKLYLEKIIQLEFNLPKFTQKLDKLVDSIFDKISSKDDIKFIKEIIESVSKHKNVTPRLLVRFINQAKIQSEIKKQFKDESNSKDIDYFSIYLFVLFLENFYEKQYEILSVATPTNLAEVKKENKESILKDISCDDTFYQLLETSSGKLWLNENDIRKITDEFLDNTKNISDEEISQKEFKKEQNIGLEELKEKLLNLEDKIKNEKDFKKYILMDENSNESYDTFIKVKDKNGKEFEFSKFLVTNIWYNKVIENHNSRDNFNHAFQPVVEVSWYDAKTFCEKLNKINKDKYEYNLPTKEEFEYLASIRGDGKYYPWGEKWDNTRCNNSKLKLNKTSIVGALGFGNSKDGICDMSGNVWKWTNSKYGNEDYYIKGCSWGGSNSYYFYAGCNYEYNSHNCDHVVGFFLTRTKVSS